ncbi:hypothetical protein AB0945_43000 [Streptomyces sp. NPDC005474]|uniref:hypothetical protein n=1 Tax=Streptomyces sp. NPDC005474 TaxID=3154878 RepID=UPI003455EBEB
MAEEALKTRPSAGPLPSILLDLAIGYFFLRSEDKRLSNWAERLVTLYPRCADVHVIMARSQRHPKTAAAHLRFAVDCGLPVVTQGLQLLNDSLHLLPRIESTVERVVLPFATCARADTVLTTFWGEYPDEPRTEPILCRRPKHAVPLGSGADPVSTARPITTAVRTLSESCAQMPPQVRRHLGVILLSLQDGFRLASRLSTSVIAPDVAELSSQLLDALGHGERQAASVAGALRAAGAHRRAAGSATQLLHDQAAFTRTAHALAEAIRALRSQAERVTRAQAAGYAQVPAIGEASSFAAQLAVDARDAADELARAGVQALPPQSLQASPDNRQPWAELGTGPEHSTQSTAAVSQT